MADPTGALPARQGGSDVMNVKSDVGSASEPQKNEIETETGNTCVTNDRNGDEAIDASASIAGQAESESDATDTDTSHHEIILDQSIIDFLNLMNNETTETETNCEDMNTSNVDNRTNRDENSCQIQSTDTLVKSEVIHEVAQISNDDKYSDISDDEAQDSQDSCALVMDISSEENLIKSMDETSRITLASVATSDAIIDQTDSKTSPDSKNTETENKATKSDSVVSTVPLEEALGIIEVEDLSMKNGVNKDDSFEVHYHDGTLNLVEVNNYPPVTDDYELSVLNFDNSEPSTSFQTETKSVPLNQPLTIDCPPDNYTIVHDDIKCDGNAHDRIHLSEMVGDLRFDKVEASELLEQLRGSMGSDEYEWMILNRGPSSVSPHYSNQDTFSDPQPRPHSALSDSGAVEGVPKRRKKRKSKQKTFRKVIENLGPESYFDQYVRPKKRPPVPGYVHDHVYPLHLKFRKPSQDSDGSYEYLKTCSRCAPRRHGPFAANAEQTESESDVTADENVNGIVPIVGDNLVKARKHFTTCLDNVNEMTNFETVLRTPVKDIQIETTDTETDDNEFYTTIKVFHMKTGPEKKDVEYENVKNIVVGWNKSCSNTVDTADDAPIAVAAASSVNASHSEPLESLPLNPLVDYSSDTDSCPDNSTLVEIAKSDSSVQSAVSYDLASLADAVKEVTALEAGDGGSPNKSTTPDDKKVPNVVAKGSSPEMNNDCKTSKSSFRKPSSSASSPALIGSLVRQMCKQPPVYSDASKSLPSVSETSVRKRKVIRVISTTDALSLKDLANTSEMTDGKLRTVTMEQAQVIASLSGKSIRFKVLEKDKQGKPMLLGPIGEKSVNENLPSDSVKLAAEATDSPVRIFSVRSGTSSPLRTSCAVKNSNAKFSTTITDSSKRHIPNTGNVDIQLSVRPIEKAAPQSCAYVWSAATGADRGMVGSLPPQVQSQLLDNSVQKPPSIVSNNDNDITPMPFKSTGILSEPPKPTRLMTSPDCTPPPTLVPELGSDAEMSSPAPPVLTIASPFKSGQSNFPVTEKLPSTVTSSSDGVLITSSASNVTSLASGSGVIRTVGVDCDLEELDRLCASRDGILQLPDGGMLVPIDDDEIDEKDQQIRRLEAELAAMREQTNRNENFLTYERWAHEDTKRQLVEQRQLVKWFSHQVKDLLKHPPARKKKRNKIENMKGQTEPPAAPHLPTEPFQDDEIELEEYVPEAEPTATPQDHDYIQTPVDKVQCPICGVLLMNINSMMNHRARMHKDWRKCDTCGIECKNAKELDEHKTECSPPPEVKTTFQLICKYCRKTFPNSTAMRAHHEEVHGVITKYKHVCPFCHSSFDSGIHLRKHLNRYHVKQKAVWQGKPLKKYRRPYTVKLRDTNPQVVETTPISEAAVASASGGTSVAKVKSKVKSKSPTKPSPTSAGIAEKEQRSTASPELVSEASEKCEVITTLKSLAKNSSETGISEKLCRYCNAQSSRDIRLGSAACSTAMRKELQCHLCGKKMKSGPAMGCHWRMHGLKTLACRLCGKTCVGQNAMNQHFRFKHKGKSATGAEVVSEDAEVTEQPKKPLKCVCCRREFPNEQYLNMHYSYTAKRKFNQCKYCGKRFDTSLELRRHEEEHNGEESPFSCQMCPVKKFRTSNTLLSHRMRLHSDMAIVDFYMPEISQKMTMDQFEEQLAQAAETVENGDSLASDSVTNTIPESPEKARKSLGTPRKMRNVTETGEAEPTEECTYCWDVFRDKPALNLHMQMHRMENEPFKCPECYQSFAWKNDRHKHRFLYHGVPMPENLASKRTRGVKKTLDTAEIQNTLESEDIATPKANKGGRKSFTTMVQLGVKSWQCCTCMKLYKNRVSANVHSTRCRKNALARMYREKAVLQKKQTETVGEAGTPIKNEPESDPEEVTDTRKEEYGQDEDDKRIVKNLLNRDLTNLKSRFEVKPIQCACCLRVFKNNFSLSRHINYMVAHWCKVCGGLYKKLALHQETKHGYQYKAIMCLQCGAVFETQTGLNEHIIEEHAKSGQTDDNQLKSVDEIKQEAVSVELQIIKHVVNVEEDSKSSLDTAASESDGKLSESRSIIALEKSEIMDYFDKKVVFGSHFLLSTSDPDSRLRDKVGARNSFKNQSRKMRIRNKGLERVKKTRSSSRRSSGTDTGSMSDDEGAIDAFSDEDWSQGDQNKVVAALEEQYSKAVSEYQKTGRKSARKSIKSHEARKKGLAQSHDEGSSYKFRESKSKKKESLFKSDIFSASDSEESTPKKKTPEEKKKKLHKAEKTIKRKFDRLKMSKESESSEDDFQPVIKHKKHKTHDSAPLRSKDKSLEENNEESGEKKFKIPRKSPMKRPHSLEEESPSKKLKTSDSAKNKVDLKLLQMWKSMGSAKTEPGEPKKKMVAKKSMKSLAAPSPEPQTITLYESGELAKVQPQKTEHRVALLGDRPKAKARKTIHGIRPQPEPSQGGVEPGRSWEPADSRVGSTSRETIHRNDDRDPRGDDRVKPRDDREGRRDDSERDDRGRSRDGSRDRSRDRSRESRYDDSSVGSKTPSEGGRTPADSYAGSEGGRTPIDDYHSPTKPSYSNLGQKARKSSHGTTSNVDGRRRPDDWSGRDRERNDSRERDDRRDPSRRYDEPPRRADDRRRSGGFHDNRDDRSRSTSSDRRLERSDSRNRDSVERPIPLRSARDEFSRAKAPLHKKAILLDVVPDMNMDRDEERRRSTEALKRDDHPRRPMEVCNKCGEKFPTRPQLFQHVQQIHKRQQFPEKSRFPEKPKNSDRFGRDIPNPRKDPKPYNGPVRDVRDDRRGGDRYEEPEVHTCRYCPATFSDRISRSRHMVREHDSSTESRDRPQDDHRQPRPLPPPPPPRDTRPRDDHLPPDDRRSPHDDFAPNRGRRSPLIGPGPTQVNLVPPPEPVVPQYPCTECWKQFVSQRGLELHMANKHGIEPKSDPVPHHDNPYDYVPPPGEVERRPRARMGSSFARCRCDVCGRGLPDRPALMQHMRTHHPRGSEPPDPRMNQGPPEPGTFTCKICLTLFPTFTALRQHHSQVHGDRRDDADFECRLCGKLFPSHGALNAHKAVHRSELM